MVWLSHFWIGRTLKKRFHQGIFMFDDLKPLCTNGFQNAAELKMTFYLREIRATV